MDTSTHTGTPLTLTHDEMVGRMLASDTEYDGVFIVGVRTTGIYCLPSCKPPRKPNPENVSFYATPQEARAAGLRACKLCRPDDFYLGYHAGESIVEGLVAAVFANPGAFANVKALVAASGVGSSKLHELFRTHYHSTPAEILTRARVAAARTLLLASDRQVADIAFDVGFESLSAFNTNFRKHNATSPAAFRKLPEQPAFELQLPAQYPIERMLRYLGRDANSLTERVDGRACLISMRVDDQPVIVRLELEPGRARCKIVLPLDLPPAAYATVHSRLLAMLGLTIDPLRFETLVAGAPDLAPLIVDQRGLRVPLVADPFDGLVWAVVGQQINLAFAYTLRRRLIERASHEVAHGLWLPPSPQGVAALEPADLTALSFSRAKASYIIDAAREVAEGRLPLDDMAHASATRIERSLRAVRGIGPWSAHYLMMRSFGFLDCVPVGDTGLTSGLQRFFALEQRPGREETLALMERFSPYRSLATFHLWQRFGSAA
ncbi:MAG TPA: Ada metal-binding domain-containing protein [Thermomicrobiales bacterium]|nr:Ada metal-binding domain-containing protein [Thermomicrobiales bacterium]